MIDQLAFAGAFCKALNSLQAGWQVSGREIFGPDGAKVRLTERHAGGPGHADVQFIWGEGTPREVVLWDCVSGFGGNTVDLAETAAHIWSATTAGPLLELFFSRRGEFADHLCGGDRDGLSGWHVVAGAVIGYGANSQNSELLQQWFLENPVLPALAKSLESSLDDTRAPHGIKVLLGGDSVAEVRIDGEIHEAASDVLAHLDWPRLHPASFVRSYFIALHRE